MRGKLNKNIVEKLSKIRYNKNIFSGGVAQLGERLNGIQEAMGSSPTVSIIGFPL